MILPVNVFAVKQSIVRCRESLIRLLFANFNKDFDPVQHNSVTETTLNHGIEIANIGTIKDSLTRSHMETMSFEEPIKITVEKGANQARTFPRTTSDAHSKAYCRI